MILLTTWLGAAMNLVGSGVNAISTGAQNKKNRRFADSQADQKWGRDVDMWNWQNQYNTPQAQMQRLKAAGINKLLPFIGGGSASGGSAASAHAAPMAQHKGTAPQFGNNIQDIYDLKLKKAGTDKIIEETDGLKTANDKALVTWLQEKGFINETVAATAAQKIAEAGLKDIELGRELGKDTFHRAQGTQITQGGTDITAGYNLAKNAREVETKANSLIDANAENVRQHNMARKALKEWLENPKGGWEALKTALLLILGK